MYIYHSSMPTLCKFINDSLVVVQGMELYRCVNEGQFALGHALGPESEGPLRSGMQVCA